MGMGRDVHLIFKDGIEPQQTQRSFAAKRCRVSTAQQHMMIYTKKQNNYDTNDITAAIIFQL